jgi:ADP-ribose pyrophosphatase YjhB (NUDIX family)
MSLIGALLHHALPLLKLRSQLAPVSLGVRGLVFDAAGRVLLIKHSYIPDWHFPGGGVEPGETVIEAVTRELAEEGGVRLLEPPRLVGVFHNPHWTRGDHQVFFEAGAWEPCLPRRGVEILAAEFFALHQLPPDTTRSVHDRLAERAGRAQANRW